MTTGNSVVPRKSLGQHWLNDEQSLDYIIGASDISTGDVILEIGPGTGNLTKLLLKKANKVIAVELDENLVLRLDQLNLKNLEVVNKDILSLNFNDLPLDYKLVANIPYYLTGKLIKLISETGNRPSLAVLLVQKEIAQRMSAAPGDLSILGIISQYFWDISLGKVITADKFDPPPKVDSQVIILKRKPGLPLNADQQIKFFQLIRIGFAAKRKTLLNNLSSGYDKPKEEISKNLLVVNIDPGRRPQSLSLEDWLTVFSSIV